jgi:hypothetical protein
MPLPSQALPYACVSIGYQYIAPEDYLKSNSVVQRGETCH